MQDDHADEGSMNRTRLISFSPNVGTCIGAICMTLVVASQAQTLPPPSRTVFKCEVAGKVVYSDSPCLGARKVDVEPTRGADKSTGKERVGADVSRERQREGLADALKPITGMNAKQFNVATNRTKLNAEAQAECRKLDVQIPVAEADEAKAVAPDRQAVQVHLLKLRQQFKDLRC
jgi:hypothetical protein